MALKMRKKSLWPSEMRIEGPQDLAHSSARAGKGAMRLFIDAVKEEKASCNNLIHTNSKRIA